MKKIASSHFYSPLYFLKIAVVLMLFIFLLSGATGRIASAEDWPTYRRDNLRSGATNEKLTPPLTEKWIWRSPAPPAPAWTGPAKWDAYAKISELRSMRNFDPVFHVTIANDQLFFGSSSDDAAHCLNAQTGEEKWTFFTDGPVRLPPTYHEGRVYFGSDDGHVYCADASTGAPIWKYKADPSERLIPNNGKLISQSPCRTDVLVQGGICYFAASLLPWENSYLCAVDAKTGSDTGPGLYKIVETNVTMQGAMLASVQNLYVLQGRSAPLLFNRATGKKLGTVGQGGGSFAVLTDDSYLIHGPGNKSGWLSLSKGQTRDHLASVGGADRMVISGGMAYLIRGRELSLLDRKRYFALHSEIKEKQNQQSEMRGKIKKIKTDTPEKKDLQIEIDQLTTEIKSLQKSLSDCLKWKAPCLTPHDLILAGDLILVGGNDRVAAYAASDGKEVWSAPVQGRAHGLAASGGRLYVSTDTGDIVCFGR